MSENLKEGDLCMVVRDTLVTPANPCHGSLVGAFVTLDHRSHMMLEGGPISLILPVWIVKRALACPRCGTVRTGWPASDLQKLGGAAVPESTPIERRQALPEGAAA